MTPAILPGDLHKYYGSKLDIMEALNPKGASACPAMVVIKGRLLPCKCAIGHDRTVRVMHLLEDLHFYKSPLVHSSSTDACIARTAKLIAGSTFCSRHDSRHNNEQHDADMEERFATIYAKARGCPMFLSDDTGCEDSHFGWIATALQAFGAQTPHSEVTANVADMEDKVPLPRPKRARVSSDDVGGGDQVPQWNSSIWDDPAWTVFDATGALQGDVLGRKEADNKNGAAELFTFALDMTSDQFDFSLPLTSSTPPQSPETMLKELFTDSNVPVPASTTVTNSESPSAAKLGRITANAAPSTATESAGSGSPSPQTSFAGKEDWQQWFNDQLGADGSMYEDAMLPADGSVDVAATS